MTEFITRNHGHSCFEIIIKTTNPEHYKATQDFVRRLIDHAKPVTDINVGNKMREKLIKLNHECVSEFFKPGNAKCDYEEFLADYLIAHGVTIPNRGHWIIHSSGRGEQTTNWAECSECHVCGSPQWKVCPVCEVKMEDY